MEIQTFNGKMEASRIGVVRTAPALTSSIIRGDVVAKRSLPKSFSIDNSKVSATVVCELCGADAPRRGNGQKYCVPCSSQRDLERKRLWIREHPLDKKKSGENSRKAMLRARDRGLEISQDHAIDIAWLVEEVELDWLVRVSLPFDYSLSKNHFYSTTDRDYVQMRRETRTSQDDVVNALRQAIGDRKVARNKVWIDIFVQKPNHKGDAINVVDAVCDAVKVAIGIDDRWFSIRRLDWQIVKENPRIYIGVGQASDVDMQSCATCGRIRPFKEFARNKAATTGHNRICNECRRVLRKGGAA